MLWSEMALPAPSTMEDVMQNIGRPIGSMIREVRKTLNAHLKGAVMSTLQQHLELQTQRPWRRRDLCAALSYLQGDEAECYAGVWFPEQNWARPPEPN